MLLKDAVHTKFESRVDKLLKNVLLSDGNPFINDLLLIFNNGVYPQCLYCMIS